MSRGIAIALAGTFGLTLLAGSLAAQPPERSEFIKMRVPVKLKSMLAPQIRARCWIYAPERRLLSQYNGTTSDWYDIRNGEFDQAIEIVMRPRPETSFAEASTYRCLLELPNFMTCSFRQGPLHSEDRDDHDNWCRAKPDQFFRTYTEGRVVPRRWPAQDGSHANPGGTDDLTIGQKPKQ
jgi:hypothetical protein